MKKEHIFFAAAVSCLGLLAGLYYPQIKEEFLQQKVVQQDVATLLSVPEEGVHGSKLGVKLFRDAIEQQEANENAFLAPFLTYAIIETLADLSEGDTHQLLTKQTEALQEEYVPLSMPNWGIIPASDYSLPMPEHGLLTLRLPFKTDKPQAQSHFNVLLANEVQIADLRLINSENTSEFTRFIVGGVCHFQPQWQIDFAANNTVRADFYNNNGAIRRINMMRARGMLRTAKADDESWEAVALFIKPTQQGNLPIAFIGILPKNNAQKFAQGLTLDMLCDIRKRLAEAKPQDCCISIPRIISKSPIISLNKTMDKWGLGCLFDAKKANFAPVTPQKIALDSIFVQYSLNLVENTQQAPSIAGDTARSLIFDKPFIWMIGDLTTNHPPFYMGFLQNL